MGHNWSLLGVFGCQRRREEKDGHLCLAAIEGLQPAKGVKKKGRQFALILT
jgi:hypothetical protein